MCHFYTYTILYLLYHRYFFTSWKVYALYALTPYLMRKLALVHHPKACLFEKFRNIRKSKYLLYLQGHGLFHTVVQERASDTLAEFTFRYRKALYLCQIFPVHVKGTAAVYGLPLHIDHKIP